MRVCIMGDIHSGHCSGLTPPRRLYDPLENAVPEGAEDNIPIFNEYLWAKFEKIQQAMWSWYVDTLEKWQPIDTLIHNGDGIEGKGERSGSTELITADRLIQARMGAFTLKQARAKTTYLIRGTPAHVGKEEEWEDVLAALLGAKHVGDHDWFEYAGVTIDAKHKVSSSIIPHGRYTALAREALWNVLWAERQLQPKAKILVRSHVHYFVYCGDRDKLAMTVPAMQGWTKYGARACSGTVDMGMVFIDINDDGSYAWKPELMDLQFMARQPLPL